jgi:hypothetical protein
MTTFVSPSLSFSYGCHVFGFIFLRQSGIRRRKFGKLLTMAWRVGHFLFYFTPMQCLPLSFLFYDCLYFLIV